MIVKVRYPIEKPMAAAVDPQSTSRVNISNNNYRNKFYPENASFMEGQDEAVKGRKNISLPKITKAYVYNNPYKPEDESIAYIDKEEKNEVQNFKNNITARQNKYEPSAFVNNPNERNSLVVKNLNEIKGLPPINNGRNCNSNEKVHHPIKLYSIKDYKEIKKNFDYIKGIEKGGLGPCKKDEKWQERKKLVEKMMKFSYDVKIVNTSKIAKYFEESIAKEQTVYNKNLNISTRQKGWEFAKNIEPPKSHKKKENFETILEKEDLEDTLEFYEQRHKDLSRRLYKGKNI